MKILVDGFFRSGSHYIYYAFKNAYPNDEVFYGYPIPHYGIDEMVKSEFSNIAITIRNPYDVLVSCINEFLLVDDDTRTNFYINQLKGYLTIILQEKNNVCVIKFDEMITDFESCLNKFSNKFPECSNFIVPDFNTIKAEMDISAPENALPVGNDLREDAKSYLNQEKFSAKLAELNSLYNMIIE